MVCNQEASPRPKFTWKKDGNVLGTGGRRRIFDTGNLVISPVSRDDEGTYVCQASNQYGSDESRGRLIVLSKHRNKFNFSRVNFINILILILNFRRTKINRVVAASTYHLHQLEPNITLSGYDG